ncbi:class A beta-lactamase-related serine hydrolase [Sinomicrobium pectinilyticum]|uniref:Class A beta-lactamase-related serine hydrolase n=1 Tax=Sinomicrobium pectinilyticum TaxID=1084421 RepID=A0A3N0EJB8_SINP1|nr:serine hydrolase domain-containing protein [Sinomicrobium pectinilyticum]RNL87882.1 class A beta-lactamase-related serine hydrolase [Sinomicrobium pectinilyticum]
MKKTLLIVLIVFSACKQQKSSEIIPAALHHDSISQIEGIEKNLAPVHYLKGRNHKKSIPQLMQEDNIPGVSIAFFDNGKISWQKTYGYSNLADSIKVTPNTVFNGASLSKPVTAMAALNLTEQGVLTLNENVNNYLEGWKVPDNKFTEHENVTLRRLIGHTAGFERYVQSSFFPHEELPTITQMLAGEKPSVDPAVSVVYVPGQKQVYSNPGYSVIEKLIEDVTDKEFNAAITDLIFEPCDMTHSSFEQPVPNRLSKQMATGYSDKQEPYPYKLFPFKAAGGIWTTPTDLAKFLLTVLEDHHSGTNTILSENMTDSIFTKTPERLGFAKIYNNESRDMLFEHWGSNSGFTCYMVASLDRKQGVVIMTNSDNGMSLMSYITRAVAVAYNWDFLQPKVFDSIAMGETAMKRFTRKFKGGSEVLGFEVVEGALHFLNETATTSKLVPVAENTFIQPDSNTLYEFLKNKEGEVKYVRMTKADGYNSDYLKQ